MLGRATPLRLSFAGFGLLLASGAEAAELRWDGGADCPHTPSVDEQVEQLLGRPVAQIDGMAFDVEIGRVIGERWLLVVQTRIRVEKEGPFASPRIREIEGTSCDELRSAAAVAIAMAALENAAGAAGAAPEPPPAVAPEPAAPAPDPDPAEAAPEAAAESSWRFGVTAGGVVDAGALPAVAAGAQVELFVGFDLLRAVALGTLFAAQKEYLASGDAGAEFSLVLGGLLVCGEPSTASIRWLGCAGFELGELSGTGIASDPRSDGFTWAAVRAEVGAGIPLSGSVGVALRLGATVPVLRRPFVLNETDRLYEPASLTARALVGLEAIFR